jgi:hypothetical protein
MTSPEHGAQHEWSRTFFSLLGESRTGRITSLMENPYHDCCGKSGAGSLDDVRTV